MFYDDTIYYYIAVRRHNFRVVPWKPTVLEEWTGTEELSRFLDEFSSLSYEEILRRTKPRISQRISWIICDLSDKFDERQRPRSRTGVEEFKIIIITHICKLNAALSWFITRAHCTCVWFFFFDISIVQRTVGHAKTTSYASTVY